MVGYKQTLRAPLLTILLPGVAIVQNSTDSPYTRCGYDQLADQPFTNSKAMGGIAYGLRSGSCINPLNPAPYTVIDSLTFLFDGGFSMQNTNFSSEGVKLNVKNPSFDYIAMQFRLQKWVIMSIGLLPYSSVDCSMAKADKDVAPEDAQNVTTFPGGDGLHQLCVGFGVKVLKNLFVGANASYFWGEITRTARIAFPNNENAFAFQNVDCLSVHDYKLDSGAQYTQQFGRKHAVTLGAVFSPKKDLHNEAYVQRATLTNPNSNRIVAVNIIDTMATYGTPNSFGVGLTYEYDKRLIIGADFSLQKWGDVAYINQPNASCDAMKISVGAKYMPNRLSRSYLIHIKYRVGEYYLEPYYKIGGEKAPREYGVTVGLGLPFPGPRSLVNVSARYIKVHGLRAGMVDENTLRLSLGITFNEGRFFKRKVK